MPLRVRILCLNAQRQAEQNRLCILQLISELFQTQKGARSGQEFLFVDGLAQEIVRTTGNSLDSLIHPRQASDQNDRNKSRLGFRFNGPTHFESGLPRHHYVEQRQIDRITTDCFKSLIAVLGANNVMALSRKNFNEKIAVVIVIIGDQDGGFASNGVKHGALNTSIDWISEKSKCVENAASF